MMSAENLVPFLPPKFLGPMQTILLNLPLDDKSPTGSLLRPQIQVIEFALRSYTPTLCYAMNLEKAHGSDSEAEKQLYLEKIKAIKPTLVVTYSAAIDITHQWTPPEIPLTTFALVIANQQTRGKLDAFSRGMEALKSLKSGDKVLICEPAKEESVGDDMGSVQLPNQLKKKFPGVEVDWSYGTEYREKKLSDYALALHCGSGLLSKQQMIERIQDLLKSGVPVANHGLVMSFIASPESYERVMAPWRQ